jgi:hypothetical protein
VTGEIILQKTNLYWPIILFPYYEQSHTFVYTGQRAIKDIKFSTGFAKLCLTDRMLSCKLIFPPLLLIEIQLADITQVFKREGMAEILEVRFDQARKGRLTRFALTGEPPKLPRDRVFLNLGDEAEMWNQELNKCIRAGAAPTDKEIL